MALIKTLDASTNMETTLHKEDPIDAIGRKSVLLHVDGFIIVTEFCERLAYYGFAGSLVLFFQTQLGLSNAEADVQYSYWSGACYITPLIGGYIADSCLGRYKSILIFSIIYLAGLILIVEGSIPGKVSATVVFTAMYIVAIGTGGIKPNVSTLGADQFDDAYSQDRKEKESFFNWFYWSINLGAMISYTVVAYVCQYGVPGLGGLRWAFFTGYSIPTVMMALAIVVFVAGTPRYKIQKPSGSILAITINIIIQAFYKYIYTIGLYFRELILSIPVCFASTTSCLSRYILVNNNEKNINQDSLLTTTDISSADMDILSPTYDHNSSNNTNTSTFMSSTATVQQYSHFLDRSKQEYGGSYTTIQVECVKLVTRLTPFLIAMIPYWGVYSQMSTAFQNQGCQMNLYLGNNKLTSSSFSIPVSALNIFDTLAILLLLPLFDRIIYPYFKRPFVTKYSLTSLNKIGWGFFFAFLSMIVAASIETARIHYAPLQGDYYNLTARKNISPCQNIDDYNPYRYQQWQAGIGSEGRGGGEESIIIESPSFCKQICNEYYIEYINTTTSTIITSSSATSTVNHHYHRINNLFSSESKYFNSNNNNNNNYKQQPQLLQQSYNNVKSKNSNSMINQLVNRQVINNTNITELLLLNLTCIQCQIIPQMSSLSVFWQIPQFILIGISEILASITSLDFFYSQAPSSMRSVTQSFNLATTALGSLIMIPLIFLINHDSKNEWLPQNLDQGHLTWYFLLLALLMIFNQLYFWYICQNYEYKTNAELQMTYETFLSSSSSSSGFENIDTMADSDIQNNNTTITFIENNSNSNIVSTSSTNKMNDFSTNRPIHYDRDNTNDSSSSSSSISSPVLNPMMYRRISNQGDPDHVNDESNTDESKFS